MPQLKTDEHVWPFKAYWLRDAPANLKFMNRTRCPYTIFMCFVRIYLRKQTATCATYIMN